MDDMLIFGRMFLLIGLPGLAGLYSFYKAYRLPQSPKWKILTRKQRSTETDILILLGSCGCFISPGLIILAILAALALGS